MAKRSSAATVSQHIHDEIQQRIVSGVWAPGERLQLSALSEEFDTSSTVIREALTRLTGERLVVLRPNRGYFLPTLSLDELRDITRMRAANESLAVSLAIERGDLDWESRVLAAHHTMGRMEQRSADGRIDPEWAAAHQRFHRELLSACDVPMLEDICGMLSDLQQLYNRWAARSTDWSARDLSAEHQAILDAALARDADAAARLLTEHYERTLAAITALGVEVGLPEGS